MELKQSTNSESMNHSQIKWNQHFKVNNIKADTNHWMEKYRQQAVRHTSFDSTTTRDQKTGKFCARPQYCATDFYDIQQQLKYPVISSGRTEVRSREDTQTCWKNKFRKESESPNRITAKEFDSYISRDSPTQNWLIGTYVPIAERKKKSAIDEAYIDALEQISQKERLRLEGLLARVNHQRQLKLQDLNESLTIKNRQYLLETESKIKEIIAKKEKALELKKIEQKKKEFEKHRQDNMRLKSEIYRKNQERRKRNQSLSNDAS